MKKLTTVMLLALLGGLLGCDNGAIPGGGEATSVTTLYDVAMLSADEGWAVGDNYGGRGIPPRGAMLHYRGGKWQEVSVPTQQSLRGIAMTSAAEGWAVGVLGTVLQYKDGAWTVVSGINNNSNLNRVFMLTVDEGWAVGSYSSDTVHGSILHYSGGKWQEQANPVPEATLYDVYMTSVSSGWAVGGANSGAGVVLRYADGKWQPEYQAPSGLAAIHMLSADEGWAVGSTLLHYSGGKWQNTEVPDAAATLYDIEMDSRDYGFAVGAVVGSDRAYSVVMHYDGSKWRTVPAPGGKALNALALGPAGEAWAVGSSESSSGSLAGAMILHLSSGRWRSYP